MACPDRLSQWTREVSTAFAHLSKPQRWGLALWSAGIALAGAAGLAQVSALLSAVLLEPEATVFQRLREWYLDKEQKSGKKRRELEVATCFGPSTLMGGAIDPGDAGREVSPGFGSRCNQSAQSVDDPGHQCVSGRMCYSGRLEGSSRRAGRVVAASLGSLAQGPGTKRSSRVGSNRAGRSGIICPLAVGLHSGAGMASLSELARQDGVFCGQSQSAAGDRVDALGAGI